MFAYLKDLFAKLFSTPQVVPAPDASDKQPTDQLTEEGALKYSQAINDHSASTWSFIAPLTPEPVSVHAKLQALGISEESFLADAAAYSTAKEALMAANAPAAVTTPEALKPFIYMIQRVSDHKYLGLTQSVTTHYEWHMDSKNALHFRSTDDCEKIRRILPDKTKRVVL